MLRFSMILGLCIALSFALPALAQDKESSSFKPNDFATCVEKGGTWSKCATEASSGNTPTSPFVVLPKAFQDLLLNSATTGARIWTPSAVERFQGYISRPSNSPHG